MKILKGLSKAYHKNFKKNEILRVQVIDELSRMKTFYIKTSIKDGKALSIDGRTYILDKDSVFMNEGIPTVLFSYKNFNPKNIEAGSEELRPLLIHEEDSNITPSELNTMLDNKIVEDMFRANKDQKKEDLMFFSIMGIGAVVLFNTYLVFNMSGVLDSFVIEFDYVMNEVQNILGNLR